MIPVYVLIVFGKRRAEEVAALCVGYEVEIIRLSGRERCAKSNFARISDWPGRQAAVFIRVVRRIVVQILARKCAVVFSNLFERIDHRGIALQRHASVQTVFEDAGDERPLVRLWSFPLDQRSERYDGERGSRHACRRRIRR